MTRESKWTKSYRERNPKRYAYMTLRDNAKRRKKEFTITYEQFCEFCYRYKYMGKKGRTKDGYGVDRDREEGGYTLDNMTIKKNGNNTRKYKDYDYRTKQATTVTVTQSDEKDLPF